MFCLATRSAAAQQYNMADPVGSDGSLEQTELDEALLRGAGPSGEDIYLRPDTSRSAFPVMEEDQVMAVQAMRHCSPTSSPARLCHGLCRGLCTKGFQQFAGQWGSSGRTG